jgi:uncharacterized protein (TIGR02145 family)
MVARNFESPVDANTDNVYEVSIFATDSDGNTDNENQKITIIGNIAINNQDFSIAENSPNATIVGNVQTTNNPTEFSIISGNTNNAFAIDNAGQITIADVNEINFEATEQYTLAIQINKDLVNSKTANITISITDVIESATFTINAIADISISENETFTGSTPSLSGDTPISKIVYSLGGNDANSFTINSTTGVISMVARDFESPVDANTDNVYEVSIIATDADGNTASSNQKVTVKVVLASINLGTQTWTASNISLVPTAYNNLDSDYNTDGIEADGWHYSYDAARNVCPSGWRLPSDDDWKKLEGFLGMSVTDQNKEDGSSRGTDEGTQLRVGGSSGFNARLAGFVSTGYDYYVRGTRTYFWTSTVSPLYGNKAKTRYIYHDDENLFRVTRLKTDKNSVRCIKK